MDAEWLKTELSQTGRSQSALARWLKIDPSSVNRMAAGARKISADEAEKIKEYLKVTGKGTATSSPSNENLTWGQRLVTGASPALQMLPIRFRVQAGTWMEIDAYAQEDYGEGPIPGDPRIPSQYQWLEEVMGESMNLLIRPGSLVHVVDAIWLSYSPRQDDVVVIERLRRSATQVERSLKQVFMVPGGLEFRGRSTNELWNTPIKFRDGLDEENGDEVRIAGWVRHAIQRF